MTNMGYLYLILGLAFLVKGADYFIEGSTSLAKRFRVPSLIIGLSVVAVGTSLPEFVIGIISALNGESEIAVGNAVGSSVANILLILGAVALVSPPKIAHSTVWKEIPFSLLAAILLLTVSNVPPIQETTQAFLTRTDGVVLLMFLAGFIYYLYSTARRHRADLVDSRMEITVISLKKTAFYIAVGIAGLYLGGKLTVSGAVSVARGLGISEFVIATTIIAFGTTLPEQITSVKAVLRKDSDLAVGNIVGSNIINICLVIGTAALISPTALPGHINDYVIYLVAASLLLFMFLFVGEKHRLNRWQGLVFLAGYAGYIALSIIRGA